MRLDVLVARKNDPARWLRLALISWTICLLGILVRIAVQEPGTRSLYPVYERAGQNWRTGQDLYPQEQKPPGYPLFRYSPTAAAWLAPLTYLPVRMADALLHVLNWTALLVGVWWWSRTLFGQGRGEAFGAMLLMMLPLALGNLSNGQSNSLVLAVLLAGLAAAAGARWNLAAVLMTVACLFKVYPIAIGLLLCLLYPRRFAPRLAAALALGLTLPFVLAEPAYVQRQYALWLNYMRLEDRSTWSIHSTNLDFQLLCRVWLRPISPRMYQYIQIVSAAFFALACLAARRAGWKSERLLTLVLGLGSVWMTVFGPATESLTYVLLAPTAAGAVLSSQRERRAPALRGVLLGAYVLLVSAQIISCFSGLFMPYRALGPQPVAGLLLTGGLLVQLFHQPMTNRDSRVPHPALSISKRSA